MTPDFYFVTLAVTAAAAAGLVGAFALMKRLALAGDVISHIALPGLGLAILYGINPLLGGAATLFLGIILAANLEKKTGLTTDVVIGVIFAASLALGALITPEEELIEALFGGLGEVSAGEFFFGIGLGLVVAYSLWNMRHKLILGLFSGELAQATKINLSRLNLRFLLVFGLAVILGLRFLGALLMGALIIIPAAAARQLTHTLKLFLIISASLSVLSVVGGIALSQKYGLDLGPAVVVIASLIFAASLLKKRN